MEDVVAFIDARQQDVAEVKRPDAIISFLKTDDLLLERVRDEEQALLEPGTGGRWREMSSSSFPFRFVVGIVIVVALWGCGAATVTTWYTDPSKSDYPIRLTNWPAIALTVADRRAIPEKLFVRWIDPGVTWEKHSAAVVGEIQRVMLEAMGGRISGDSPTELRIAILDYRASWDSPNWLGFAALEASVWKSGAMLPSLSWKSSGQTKQWNWFGVDTARGVARDAFKTTVADLLRQLYSDVGRLRSLK